ncbi:hypothetical protein O181_101117 [Austropuccinia psidii MF-1]|uniref:Uncharacterized protein n=1 Tax=Austropuccinia psidii MF-1 TaxID=1389203 RepID=A0A9Q3JFC6_9BASI|nr:hypothetical protein [Austropuccinia psidii MF-1]
MDEIVKSLQEGHAPLIKDCEETKKRLNQVFEDPHHSTRDSDFLDQRIKKLFNAYLNKKPQPQGHVTDSPYNQEDIKPYATLVNKARFQFQYQDGDTISYSEKESLKKLEEASNCPKLSVAGEYDHIELIYYIYGLFTDVPSIPDYLITDRIDTELKGHASILYTEMKEIHARRKGPWWQSQIIQKYRNGTWICQKTMSFENNKYSVDKDPYEWCLRQAKRLKFIDPQMNIQMKNHELLNQIPGKLKHAVKFRCSHNCTLDDIPNILQDISKRKNIEKSSPYKRIHFREKQPFRVEFKDKPRE